MAPSADILTLEGIHRRYRRWQRRPGSLKELLIRTATGRRARHDDFWALRGVDLAVRRGEVLGICGANGHGKSTLLRVMARIEPPTAGRVTVRGRIAGLLELNAGFHAQLTGRENIALTGAIMGLTADAIRRHTPAIIEFADLGDFIDSPVVTYSAGMFMRLGFAIASHVEADIILIDEVLAVGDAAFQKKCYDWLVGLRARGATVILVSHDLVALAYVCDRVAWIDRGRVRREGPPLDVLTEYCPDLVVPGLTPAAP